LGPYPVDLMQQLDQRAVRDVGADLGGRLPVAQPAVPPQGGVGAVRPALLLAQDEEQPRIRSAAEHLRGDAPGVIDRVGRQDRRLPATMLACAEPGRCTSRMSAARRVTGAGRAGTGGGAPRQSANALSTRCRTCVSVTSPATTRSAPPGRRRSRAKCVTSSGVTAL